MKIAWRWIRFSFAALMLTVTACGGGGNSNTSSPSSPVNSSANPGSPTHTGTSTPPPQAPPPANSGEGAAWTTPTLIQSAASSNPTADIAIDAGGNAVVVWSQGSTIYSKRFTGGQGWGLSTRVDNREDAGLSTNTRIAMNESGNAIAVWLQRKTFDSLLSDVEIWANRYDVATGWRTAELVVPRGSWFIDDHFNRPDPLIVMDSGGNATVVWYSNMQVNAIHYTAGTGWGSQQVVASASPFYPQIAGNGSGDVLAMWWQSAGPSAGQLAYQLWFSRYATPSGWSTPAMLQPNGTSAPVPPPPPNIVLDTAGSALATWIQTTVDPDCPRANAWADRYIVDHGWEPPQSLDVGLCKGLGSYAAGPVAMDASGNALAIWSKTDGPHQRLWWNRYSLQAGWSAATAFPIDDAGSAQGAALGMAPNGDAVAIWAQTDGSNEQMWADRYAPEAGWTTPSAVQGAGGLSAFGLRMASNGQGSIGAAWQNGDGTMTNVWAAIGDN